MILDYCGLVKAKRKDCDNWIVGAYYNHMKYMPYPDNHSEEDRFVHLVVTDGFDRFDKPREVITFEVIPETICPYTGRNDKHGNKIFMKDVVRPDYYQGRYFEILPYEKGNTLEWHLGNLSNLWEGTEVEIIGNTIDDPTIMERCPSIQEFWNKYYI
jgi:hypothetical protein